LKIIKIVDKLPLIVAEDIKKIEREVIFIVLNQRSIEISHISILAEKVILLIIDQ